MSESFKWRKLGLVWGPDGSVPWAKSHAMIPTPVRVSEDVTRVFVTTRDEAGVGRVVYVDVDAKEPWRVLGSSPIPVLDVGAPGMFDDNGVAACSVVLEPGGGLAMYYVGFELCRQVRYRLFTGLARSSDGGENFQRVSEVPVLDRSRGESLFRCGPFCVLEGSVRQMLYVAGDRWELVNGKQVPVYDIRALESSDGVSWAPQGRPVLSSSEEDEHGFGRPYWVKWRGRFRMVLSVRSRSLGAYRLGYAESEDGLSWSRCDEKLGFRPGDYPWESHSVAYGALYPVGDQMFMFYNGDDFGAAGFAVAVSGHG